MTFTRVRSISNTKIIINLFWSVVTIFLFVFLKNPNIIDLMLLSIISLECVLYLNKYLIGKNPFSLKNRYKCYKIQKEEKSNVITIDYKQYKTFTSNYILNLDPNRFYSVKFNSCFDFLVSDPKTNETL